MFKSPLYWFPTLYEKGMNFWYGKDYGKRLKFILLNIGRFDSVLDLGSGTSEIWEFLPRKNNYLGIERNEKFVKFARERGAKVILGDVIKKKVVGKFDVVILSDIIHHIYPNHKKLMNKVKGLFKKKIIIIDAYYDPKNIFHNLNACFGKFWDADGCNSSNSWGWLTLDQWRSLLKSTGLKFEITKMPKQNIFIILHK